MCEMLVLKSPKEIPVEQVLRWSELLDEYGVAGFSWGLAWRDADGLLKRYRATDGIRRDTMAARVLSGITSKEYLVHLRRPSLMTSIAHRNAQPYFAKDGSIAFAHNGYFEKHRDFRPAYQSQLEGTSDSEVGFLHYLQSTAMNVDAADALVDTHQDLKGNANIAVLVQTGGLHVYAGNRDNRVYSFHLGVLQVAATALHSGDDYLMQTIFPSASQVELVPLGTVVSL